jgi:hypothetical protein
VILLVLFLYVIPSEHQVTVLMSTASMTKIQVEFSDFDISEGSSITRFVVADGPPRCDYKILGKKSIHRYNNEQSYCTAPVRIGAPIKIKQYYLYPVVISSSYEERNSHITYASIEITLHYTPVSTKFSISPSLKKVFQHLIVNVHDTEDSEPLGYLIITPNSFADEVEPLAQWKEKKGWTVYVRTLSETGSSPSEIEDYIANAYLTWSPPPEYVLLIGDKDSLPAASTNPPASYTDYPYTLIDGDFFAELLIGRLPANNANELNTMVAKIIGYEQNPTLGDPTWYKRSLMTAANFPGFMTTPIPTKRWVRDRLYEHGFTTVDTVYYPPTSSGVPVTTSIDQGVVFVNYRAGDGNIDGWVYPAFTNTEIYGLNNGWKLPIVTSITCFTGQFGAQTCFGEAWLRAGNPTTPKGAVGFIGASGALTSSRWNNCLDQGIYWAFLKEDIYNLGPALYRGKMEVFMDFPNEFFPTPDSGVLYYFHTYNILGDPSLDVWTDTPDTFRVTHNASIPVGTNYLSVDVKNSSNQPVAKALVSLYKDGEVKEVGFTNTSGSVQFNFTTSSQDTLFVTVTKHNYKPHCGFCLVNNSSTYVGYYDHTIDDAGGNNNGDVNPGEPIDMTVTLKNYGTSTTATNISAKLTSTDPNVTITDSTATYSNIAPGGTATASPFIYSISTTVEHDHIIKFNLEITSSQGTWTSSIWITIQAPEFVYQRYQIPDGNGILEPGETNDVAISIKNIGGLTGSNITGILRSDNTGVSVVDSIGSFGSIVIGDSTTNSGNRFNVTASSSLSPGHPIWFTTILSGDNNFSDTVKFIITIGIIDQAKPLGSDGYGYFAYDDIDAGYDEQPTYNWVEIDPDLGGSGTILTLANDETKTVSLPFNFVFYGDSYNRVSISSNGYIAMDSTWVADMYNWGIPGVGGPPLLIAPFWDDLDPNATDSSGNVCYWHDSPNRRFIVEYSRIQHIHDPTNPTPGELQTFEAILYDPVYYPTMTGDGEILFQYKDINNDDQWHNYATVGIEDRNHANGLEYTYANSYPDAAAPLVDNRAIKFTTDPPDTFPFPGSEEEQTSPFNLGMPVFDIYPNPFSKMTNIKLQIPNKPQTLNSKITLNMYDVTGRLIKKFSFFTLDLLSSISVIWDGTDDCGSHVPEGIYFAKLETGTYKIIKKIILIK